MSQEKNSPPAKRTPQTSPPDKGEYCAAGRGSNSPAKGEYRAAGRGLTPHLRFPEFRDAGEWEVKTFEELVEVIDGDRGTNYPKSEEFFSSGYCVFLNAKNVTKNGFVFDEIQFITKEKDAALRKGKLKRSDIVLTTRGSVGNFALFSETVPYENIRLNSGMVILRIKSKLIDENYLYLFSSSGTISKTIERIAFGSAQPQLTVSAIKKFKLYHPSLPEQQRIADCLTALDDLIAAHSQKLDALNAHKKGLLQQLFPSEGETVPRLRFPEFRDAGNWEEKRLGEVATFYNGRAYKKEELLDQGKYRVLRVGNFFTNDNWYYSDLELGSSKVLIIRIVC